MDKCDDNDARLLSLSSQMDLDNIILSVVIKDTARQLLLSLPEEKNELLETTSVQCFWAPGQIEMVWKPTHYAGGQSL